MTVKELMDVLSKISDQDQQVMLSVDYGWGETLYVSDVNVGETDKGLILWGDEDVVEENV